MNPRISWPTAVVALGFFALVGLMFWRATEDMPNFDRIWAVAGPIAGVVVGAIPGFFFAQSARQGETQAQTRAEAYAATLNDTLRPEAMKMLNQIQATQKP